VSRHDGEQQAVLVHDVQSVQTPEAIVPSLVRLERVEDVQRRFAGSLCISRSAGFVLGLRAPDRKGGLVCHRPAVGEDELADEKVEGRPEAVDGIARDRAPSRRRMFADLDAPDLVARVRLILREDAVGVGFEERRDVGMKLVDVLLGPLNLDPRAD
jgi:hypothetical protein